MISIAVQATNSASVLSPLNMDHQHQPGISSRPSQTLLQVSPLSYSYQDKCINSAKSDVITQQHSDCEALIFPLPLYLMHLDPVQGSVTVENAQTMSISWITPQEIINQGLSGFQLAITAECFTGAQPTATQTFNIRPDEPPSQRVVDLRE